jgi:hypothetical protein
MSHLTAVAARDFGDVFEDVRTVSDSIGQPKWTLDDGYSKVVLDSES